MKAVIQRVSEASVTVEGKVTGRIGQGMLVLLCAEPGDTHATADRLLAKLLKLRIFSDSAGKMNLSVQDIQGGLLVVSQFTLAADVWSGNRPGFSNAADPETGERLYNYFVDAARRQHPVVETGVFGANMQVSLVNDGPVTIPVQLTS
ncbi:MAG TPA: D-aminoacyl-tRNA deacylase [Burkholderiaceae bacterium]|nr:D-aminoacyl-tRNA deacylase [Burkholderiaceae bacterium]